MNNWYHTRSDVEHRERAEEALKNVNAKKGKTKLIRVEDQRGRATWQEVPVDEES